MSKLCLFLLLTTGLPAEDLPLTGISHVAFRISDIARAREFYTATLGFPAAFEQNRADGTLGTAFMKINDTQYIEVQPGLKPDDLRMTHVSLVTTDIEKLHRMLLERGLTPMPLKPAGSDGNRSFRIIDPEGFPLEFTQYLPGSLHSNAIGKSLDPRRIATRMSHAGIATKHPEDSLAFYRDKLGFKEVWPMAPGNEKEQQWNLQVPGPDGDYIELMGIPENPTRAQMGGVGHLCLLVTDAKAAQATLFERGAHPSKPAIGKTRRWLFNAYDPDGSRIEFIEPKIPKASPSSSPVPPR